MTFGSTTTSGGSSGSYNSSGFGGGGININYGNSSGVTNGLRKEDFDQQLDYYKKLYAFTDDIQNASSIKQMENAYQFREKEGATRNQENEQAFRRLDAGFKNQKVMQESSLTNQRFMQQKGADLTDWQRNQDYNRASRAIGDMRNTRKT